MFAPGAQSSQCVSSFGEWLTPATLGTKITHRRDLRHHLRVVSGSASTARDQRIEIRFTDGVEDYVGREIVIRGVSSFL
jgi:hypothetical protein